MIPYFSIVMPVYNNEIYLPRAVESVLNQTFDNLELIIVDDGSTDQTGRIADGLAQQDPRIRVIHQSNQWIYAAFNCGIQAAGGEYTLIVNSDDLIAKNTLELAIPYVKEQNVDIVFLTVECCTCDCEQNISKRRIVGKQIPQDTLAAGLQEVHEKWFDLLKAALAVNQANIYRTSILKSHPFRIDWYGADTLLNISIASEINSVACISAPLYYYMQYESNDKMNASIGKYYPYAHEMFETFHWNYVKLFDEWGILNEEIQSYLDRQRMKRFTSMATNLKSNNCPLTLEEKLNYILVCSSDLIPMAKKNDWEEELEARILRACQIHLLMHLGEDAGTMQFLADYLEAVLRYEKDVEDFKKIEAAVMHPLNPNHVGRIFYQKLCPAG